MFTGIVEDVGKIRSVGDGRVEVAASVVLAGTGVGDSINVNGACLTVTSIDGGGFSVDVMPETLRRTNIGALKVGQGVNLERAMSAGGRFGGHFVQGHVDGTGRIRAMRGEGGAAVMTVAVPPDIGRYLVEKAYIAVDGVSLTIMRCDAASFSVSLVQHTRNGTTLGTKSPGDTVNLEVDIMAKYAEKMGGGRGPSITEGFLLEHGFLAS